VIYLLNFETPAKVCFAFYGKPISGHFIFQAELHTLRRGCNRRWELSGLNPAVIRQQMGHSSATMTALYTGQIPLEDVQAAFSQVHSSS